MHYKNGRKANVGDPVVGTTFNYSGGKTIAGTLVSCTPGPDSCSAMVGFLVTVKADEQGNLPNGAIRMGDTNIYGAIPVKVQGTEQHGTAGPMATTFYVQDYTECKHLLHAEDAAQAAQPIMATAEFIDVGDLIDQSRTHHESIKGTSDKGEDFEEGFIFAHDHIKGLLQRAQKTLEHGETNGPCKGIELAPGDYSGCDQSGGDCPTCGK